MAKQIIDARHVAGKRGAYVGGAMQTDPGAAGIELGIFQYADEKPWLEGRGALSVLWADTAEEVFAGATLGARAQSPSRVAPFVGLGAYVGVTPYFEFVLADADNIDNDDDGLIDEGGENSKEFEFFAAMYPEVGLHVWATPRYRVTASAAYMLTSEGHEHDFWLFGLNFAGLKLRQGGHNWNFESPVESFSVPPALGEGDYEPIARLPAP
jgi:hypothetical protein